MMRNIKKPLLISGAVFLLFFAIFSFAKSPSNAEVDGVSQNRLDALSKLTKVIATVEKHYVDELTLDQIVDKALKGLMTELDAHSAYMDMKTYSDMKVQMDGEFGGLGITIGMKDGALTVISPLDGTPADKAGIKAGDIVLKIDEKSTINMTLDESVELMRGKPKTSVELTIVRKGEMKPLVIKIQRDIIKVKSVYSKTIDQNILYLRIASFDKNVVELLEAEFKKYPNHNGVILDLRNNPGGLLDQAVGAVDLFVDKGVIVSQKGRDAKSEEKFNATTNSTVTRKPLVVLVNGGSASASEIVSGAIQDLKRGVIVGENSFGKGSVQVILPLDDESKEAIKLTIAKYYLPSGRTIQATGIVPDIISYPGKAVTQNEDAFRIKESELKKHLESELEKVDKPEIKEVTDDDNNSPVITTEQLFNDNQLKTAYDILKVLIITDKTK